jgi:hypothetical protein
MVLTSHRQDLLYNKIRLLLTTFTLFLRSSCMSAINPAKNWPMLLLNSSLAANTIIENKGPQSFIDTKDFACNATKSSLKTGSSLLFIGPTAPALCALSSRTAVRDTSLWLPTAATRGFFFNSTSALLATSSLRTPSSANFASFSSGAPVQSQFSLSFVAAVVFCYLISSGD